MERICSNTCLGELIAVEERWQFCQYLACNVSFHDSLRCSIVSPAGVPRVQACGIERLAALAGSPRGTRPDPESSRLAEACDAVIQMYTVCDDVKLWAAGQPSHQPLGLKLRELEGGIALPEE